MEKYTIDEQLAKRAKESYSFFDYIKNSETESYNKLLKVFEENVETLKKQNIENYERNKEKVDYLCDKYSEKLAYAINKKNSIDAMMPSVMIAGPANYPVKKAEKQNDMRHKFWKEYGNLFDEDNYILQKIKSILTNKVIYSNDEFAIEKLKEKLKELENRQEYMKRANAYYRQNKTIKAFEDMDDETADKINQNIEKCLDKAPFPSFELTNNNATIKSTKERIEILTKLKEKSESQYEKIDGLIIKENKELMRIQLFFENKPSEQIRETLKSNGFKWAPSQNAWQRQLTENAIRATKRAIAEIKTKEE